MGLNVQPIKLKTTIPNLATRNKKIKESFNVFIKEAHREISLMAVETLKDSIRLKGSVATGTLIKSVYRRLLKANSSAQYISNVGFQKPASSYAFFANYGRSAGKKPPFSAIEKWAKAIGKDDTSFVFKVMSKIAEEGTDGSFFVEDAEIKIDRRKKAILKEKVEEFKRSIS